ncbi:MCE family protein [Nocardioides ferulae]|uniref:MCE family protein n=1 Tax=Nocardioides ferulae TaxID=2340821 RepID=UPI000EB17948|nr:MCE family protein [Nocardioides ferulae]
MRALLRHPGPLAGVLAFTLVAGLLTAAVAGTLARGTDGDSLRIEAEFRDAAGVRVGDDVRIAGVRVGRVSDTRLHGETAVLTLDVDAAQRVDTATRASINYLNLMGQRYVALEPGPTADAVRPLREGESIPLARTRPALDLTELFNAFRPLFDSLRPDQVNRLAENIVATLQGEGPTLRDLTRQTARLTRDLVGRDEVIARVLDNVTLVLHTADDHRRQLVGLVRDLGTLTSGLAADREAIGAGMDDVSEVSTLLAGLAEETGPALTRDVARLRRLAGFLAQRTGPLNAALEGIPTQLGIYLRTLGYGSHLNVYVCTLAIRVLGSPTLELPPGGVHSRRCR